MGTAETLHRLTDDVTVRRVYGEPYERDGVTLIPAAEIAGGGGLGEGSGPDGTGQGTGGGIGLSARPVGAYVISNGSVTWKPAVNVNRVVLGGQLLAGLALVVTTVVIRECSRTRRVQERRRRRT